ncbi:MAG: twin-arginine translocation signal domain-containing protein, partial [Polaromonas sp.]
MNEELNDARRDFLKLAAVLPAVAVAPWAIAQDPVVAAGTASAPDIAPVDRVFITNEDSNTISVINPMN